MGGRVVHPVLERGNVGGRAWPYAGAPESGTGPLRGAGRRPARPDTDGAATGPGPAPGRADG
jgi:hypothetical protein